MKLSVFTVSTPEYNIEETIDLLKKVGYDGVEWRVNNPPPEEKPEDYSFERRYWSFNRSTVDINKITEMASYIKEKCKERSLEICSLTTYLEAENLVKIEEVMKAAVIMECPQIRVNATKQLPDQNYRVTFAKAREEVAAIEALAKKYNIKVNFEIHMGNIIPSASAAYRLVSGFDPKYIGIIHDAGNMVHEGFEDYKLGIELLGEYLSHVHIKNACWKLKEESPEGIQKWGPVWSPLKKGYANLEKLISDLKKAGYAGYLSIEDFSNEADTESKLIDNYNYLKKIL